MFLFDEPLSNLDAALRVNMRIELCRLHAELGATMIYVTHDQVEAMTMGSRIAVFNRGGIEQVGAPLDLYEHPANEFVAGFLGAPRINLISRPQADVTGGPHCDLWQLLAGQRPAAVARVGWRPEHVQVVEAGRGIPAQVVLAEHLGDASILYLRVDGVTELLHAKVAAGQAHLQPGLRVGLLAQVQSVVGFDSDGRQVA